MLGWDWLNHNAWIASLLLVVAFGGAAVTMWWHIKETRSARYNYLVVAGLLIMAASFVLAGVSVGEQPIIESRVLIPIIRLLWLAAGVAINAFMVGYWLRRVQWNGWRGWRKPNELRTIGE
jgi:hypothetical protein